MEDIPAKYVVAIAIGIVAISLIGFGSWMGSFVRIFEAVTTTTIPTTTTTFRRVTTTTYPTTTTTQSPTTTSKIYSENQIAGCEEGWIWIGESNDRDLCYRYYATSESNYNYCSQIYDASKRDDCYYAVGAWTENTYVCGLISTVSGCEGYFDDASGNPMNCKDACYSDIAVAKLIASICNYISTQDGKDICYWRVAINEKNSYHCSSVVKQPLKDSCYHNIAVQTNSINVCSPISDAETHDMCMMQVIRALKLKDISLCDQMTTTWKSSCSYEISTGNYVE